MAAADRPGIVFGAPVMLGIPVMGSVAETAVVFAAGSVTAGTVGIVGAIVLIVGPTVMVGTIAAELTPRLPISIEPNGIPVRAAPPGVVGIVDVDVGVNDDAMLVEPEPHIPDIPEVSSIPEAVDVPGGIDICDDVDVPGIAMLPVVAAVAGAALPDAVPPPS